MVTCTACFRLRRLRVRQTQKGPHGVNEEAFRWESWLRGQDLTAVELVSDCHLALSCNRNNDQPSNRKPVGALHLETNT